MDWSIFHALNGALRHQDGGQDAALAFNASAIFVLVAVAGLFWFVGRPGGSPRPKLAALSAAMSGAVALLLNFLLGRMWFHDRPFVDHPRLTLLLVHHAPDNSFPSDHASLAFGIAFAIAAFYRPAGLLLVLCAAAIAIDRVFIGVHYPIDVASSVGVGVVAAWLVAKPGRPIISAAVELISRVTDRAVAPIWAGVDRRLAPRRGRA